MNTNITRYADAKQIVDSIIEILNATGGTPLGLFTVADLVAVLEERNLLDHVLPGHGSHDPTIGRWLDERGDDIEAELAKGAL